MPSHPYAKSRWEPWPPTRVRLTPSTPKDYPSLEDIDDDPLTYFLTPAPDDDNDAGPSAAHGAMDDDDDMMDFDAGIESPHNDRDVVRSVSPSSLDGLDKSKSKPKGKSILRPTLKSPSQSPFSPPPQSSRRLAPRDSVSPPVPDLSDRASTPDTNDDDDEEDYIRFYTPRGPSLPLSMGRKNEKSKSAMELANLGGSNRSGSDTGNFGARTGNALTADALLTSSSFPVGSLRGRSRSSSGRGRGRQQHHMHMHQSLASRNRANRLWREPSPDVWSIEEETEEEMLSDMGSSVGPRSDAGDGLRDREGSEKTRKKVRFMLPAEVM